MKRPLHLQAEEVYTVHNGSFLPTDPVLCSLQHRKFLGAFSKLRKATTKFMSVWPHGATRLPMDEFSENLIFEYLLKISPENSSLIKIW
jgi:hypothetical protein